MLQSDKGIKAMRLYWKEKAHIKAVRLVRGAPIRKEIYMNKEELRAYIMRYLDNIPDGEVPDENQVNVAKDMYKNDCKYSDVDANTSAELDMGKFKKHAKKPTKSVKSKS